MTDQAIVFPKPQSVTKRVKRIPPEVTRWLLELSKYEPTPELVTAMEVSDDEFGFAILLPGSWRMIASSLHGAHVDRYRALFTDQNGVEKGDEHAD